jgi:hypothetical protein
MDLFEHLLEGSSLIFDSNMFKNIYFSLLPMQNNHLVHKITLVVFKQKVMSCLKQKNRGKKNLKSIPFCKI